MMWSSTSLSKHFIMMGVSATNHLERRVCYFFGTGMIVQS